jgi:hypothetical protein
MMPHSTAVRGGRADFGFTLGHSRAQKWGLREL